MNKDPSIQEFSWADPLFLSSPSMIWSTDNTTQQVEVAADIDDAGNAIPAWLPSPIIATGSLFTHPDGYHVRPATPGVTLNARQVRSIGK